MVDPAPMHVVIDTSHANAMLSKVSLSDRFHTEFDQKEVFDLERHSCTRYKGALADDEYPSNSEKNDSFPTLI
jgi:hypothetical protein